MDMEALEQKRRSIQTRMQRAGSSLRRKSRMRCLLPTAEIYEAGAFKSETGAISLQPLGGGQATIPHMKAKHVPYQLMYGP